MIRPKAIQLAGAIFHKGPDVLGLAYTDSVAYVIYLLVHNGPHAWDILTPLGFCPATQPTLEEAINTRRTYDSSDLHNSTE